MNKIIKSSIPTSGRRRCALLACAVIGSVACAPEDGSEPDEGANVQTDVAPELEQSEQQLEEGQTPADFCHDVLVAAVDTKDISINGANAHALAKASCREEANSASGGGNFFNLVSGGGSASSWDKFCESYRSSESSEQATSVLLKVANETAVNAWLTCMLNQNGGLACQHKPGNVIEMTYRDPRRLGDLTNTLITATNLNVPDWRLAEPRLPLGVTRLGVEPKRPLEDSLFIFNGDIEKNGERIGCTVLIKSPRTIRLEMGRPWTNLAIMYRDLGTAVDAISAGSPTPTELPAYNAFVLRYWAASVKSNECTTDNATDSANCTRPPLAQDYNFSFTMPGLRCPTTGTVKLTPQTIKGNALDYTPSLIRTVVRTRALAYEATKKGACGPFQLSMQPFGGS